MTRTRFLAAGLLLAAVVPLAACGGGGNPLDPGLEPRGGFDRRLDRRGRLVKVGSADFPEAALLGEIYAQALEAKGIKVTRQFNIGSRETYLKAIPAARSTCSPSTPARCSTTTTRTPRSCSPTRSTPRSRRRSRRDSRVLDKSAAEDKNSLAVTKQTASEWSLKAIPDLAAHQGDLTIGAPPEFKTRQQGLVGLKSVYNITPKEFRPLAEPGDGRGAEERPGQGRQHLQHRPVDRGQRFVVLGDPQSLFGSRERRAADRPRRPTSVKTALNAVSAKLDTAALADMVKQVVVDKKDAERGRQDVARERRARLT